MSDDGPLSVAARSALLDHLAATAIAQLGAGGVRAVLLKGPSIARWLYEDCERGYVDIDLLISPRSADSAVQLLRALGYTPVFDEAAPMERGVGWQNEQALRGPFNIEIDLHHRLIGVPSAERCWDVLSRRTAALTLGGAVVETLTPEARTLHLALHAAQNGRRDEQALEDLRRGAMRLPERHWQAAADLAAELACTQAMAGGLRLILEGRDLAARLGLPNVSDVSVAIRVRGGSQDALFFERLRSGAGWRVRVAVIGRELFPTAVFLRGTYPIAARGRFGLIAARLWRPITMITRLPPAVVMYLQARSEATRASR